MNFAWSFSRLQSFEQCPQLCYRKNYCPKHLRLPFEETEALKKGKETHLHLERAIYAWNGSPEPAPPLHEDVEFVRPILQSLYNQYTVVIPEEQLAFTEDLKAADWFGKDAWVRVIVDVQALNQEHALVIDWKTGKVRPSVDQLGLCAWLLMARYPHLQVVDSAFVWLEHKDKTIKRYTRDEFDSLDKHYRDRAALIKEALDINDWPTKKNQFCNWCQLKPECEEWV